MVCDAFTTESRSSCSARAVEPGCQLPGERLVGEILVDDALAVEVGDRARHADGHLEEPSHRHGRPEEKVERLAAKVLEHQGRHALVGLERERPHDLGGLERAPELVLVPEPP
jgi:hypothetical protein